MRHDKAKAEGWKYPEPVPEPVTCQFCGKTLYYYGGTFASITKGNEKRIVRWFDEPERCECPEAAAFWEKCEADKKAEAEADKRRKEHERMRQKSAKLMMDSGIRIRFRTRTFEWFEIDNKNRKAYTAAKQYADNFSMMLPAKDERGNARPPAKEKNGLFITGSYGTGKTHLAAAIANQLIQGGTPVICMTMIDLLARIRQTFDREDSATEAEIMRIYEDIPLLIIDDIGSEQPTEWGITKVFAIINARYEAYMPIIITTNYTGTELIRRMTPTTAGGRLLDSRNAEKTLDRLKEMCVGIEMSWESWRPR